MVGGTTAIFTATDPFHVPELQGMFLRGYDTRK
jgi:hypothetical protein